MDYLSVTPKTGARCEHPVRHPRLKRISECVLPGGHPGAHQHLEATLVRWAELDQARIAELEAKLQFHREAHIAHQARIAELEKVLLSTQMQREEGGRRIADLRAAIETHRRDHARHGANEELWKVLSPEPLGIKD